MKPLLRGVLLIFYPEIPLILAFSPWGEGIHISSPLRGED